MRQLERGGAIANQRISLNTHLDNWLADVKAPTLQPHSLRCYANRLAHVRPHIGHYPLHTLQPHHIRHCFRQLEKKGLSDTTLHDIHVQLAMALKSAVDDRLIPWNPIANIRAPKVSASTRQALSIDDVRRLIDATSDDPLGPLFHLMVTTGLRIGEATALTWEYVDTSAHVVKVRHAIKLIPGLKLNGGGLAMGEPKTDKAKRDVPIDTDVCSTLQRHRVTQLEQRIAAPVWDDLDLVFPNHCGQILAEQTAIHALYDACDTAEIRKVTLHELRHTYGTRLIELGTDLATVAKLMGHNSIKTTVDIYGHITSESQRAASTRLHAAIQAAGRPV